MSDEGFLHDICEHPEDDAPRLAYDILAYNRRAWDRQVAKGNRWTVPVGPEVIAAARRGDWHVLLTPTRPVPREWFGPLAGLEVLCLASAGGQQAPVLAAAGAAVTVLDNSPAQLAQDRLVADREGLQVRTALGDMADLSAWPAGSFALVFHPCSNCFVPDVRPVWREAFRVLRPGGVLLAGVVNPALYLFDDALAEKGELVVRHAVPYSDAASLTDEERRRYTDRDEPLVYGHTLEDQLGGQLDAGFVLAGLYEDRDPAHPLARLLPTFLATRAVKMSSSPVY
jgi:SAM-dependent methyltransferase